MSSTVPLTFGSPGLTSVENQVKGLIAATEANIERLTAQIHELTSMRERERSVLATLRLMIVPIGKLPTELLVEIFKHAVHTPVINSRYNTGSGTRYSLGNLFKREESPALCKVLCISQVSPYWRQIIHNTPQLWAEGFVEICLGRELTDQYLDGLEIMLGRSTPFPISVSLTPCTLNTSAYFQSSKPIARIMAKSAQRWKNLNINLDSFLHFNDLPPATFETLERLFIDDFSNQTDPVIVFQSSPCLRNFTLRTYFELSKIHLFHLPWSQLTHLDVEDLSPGGCRTALLQCINLIWGRFHIYCRWDMASPATDSPIITLPFLNRLMLHFYGYPDHHPQELHSIEAFLVALALPSLKTLDIEFDDETPWTIQVFSEFQSRSPNIDKITLTFSSINSEGLIALLRHGPALRTLTLQICYNCVDDVFFETLRYDDAHSAPLAPKLQDIRLDCVESTFEEDLFEAVIRSRWWKDGERILSDGSPPRVTPLKTVFVRRETVGFSDETKDRMQELVDQGLVLTLL
ncbi:hypothetical protein B0H13DRAFT_966050 [Mycena leptocephala]|nr:hypothetical protein B0H13DRAFT_966050 [Mycena leptocephala]